MDNTENLEDGGRPLCWIVCRKLGVASEVWLYRQVVGLRRFKREVVCWAHLDEAQFPAVGFKIRKLPFECSPHDGSRRWLVRLMNLHRLNFYGTVGKEATVLEEALKMSKPRLILGHFGHTALRILPLGLKCGIPVVAHFNGLDASGSLKNRWYRSSLKSSLKKFSAIIVVADYMRAELVALGADPRRIHLIPYGVPVNSLPRASRVMEQPCRFISVGRFTEKKAPLLVVKAFARCLRKWPDMTLVMVGDGPLIGEARDLARQLGVEDRIFFRGSMSSAAVLLEMSEASVFVQHSITASTGDMEGWPVAIAEAMGIGLPVIATRHAGITDQVDHNDSGFLVNENDWEEMSQRMEEMALDPESRLRMGKRAAEIASSRFDLAVTLKRMEEVLFSVVDSKA